ncbi:hypothetical protein JOH51_001927 [Rhizobium leguminosarum]|nr:hypothetical protein [Rhizobium leguminosarum]
MLRRSMATVILNLGEKTISKIASYPHRKSNFGRCSFLSVAPSMAKNIGLCGQYDKSSRSSERLDLDL